MSIEKTQQMNQLLDAYGMLLTDKQQVVLTSYYQEDFSLAEIADNLTISRSAVSDHLKRSEKMLLDYEKKLKLVEKSETRSNIYDKIKAFENSTINQWVEELENME